MLLGGAALRRFEAEGRRSEDLPLVQWVLETALTNIQTAREGIHQNLRLPGVGNALGKALGLYARLNRFGAAPSDRVTHQAAQTLMQPGEQRDRLTGNAYVPSDPASAPSATMASPAADLVGEWKPAAPMVATTNPTSTSAWVIFCCMASPGLRGTGRP